MARSRTARLPKLQSSLEHGESSKPELSEEGAKPSVRGGVGGRKISKAQAVRQALGEGLDDLDDLDNYLKTHFGITMPRQQLSAYKSQAKAKAKEAGDTPKRKGAAPSTPRSSGSGAIPPDLFNDLKSMREIRDKYSETDWGKMVDAIS